MKKNNSFNFGFIEGDIAKKRKFINPRTKSLGIFGIVIILATIFAQTLTQVYPPEKTQVLNLPYNEKISDGVWELKNREPVRQVLASGKKIDLSLKESRIGQIKVGEAKYKWSVVNANGTKFEFGEVDSDTPQGKVIPVVNVTNKNGWFVRYMPQDLKENYVTPEVKGNVIEWEIGNSVTARYTMKQDRVKADYIVSNKESITDNKLDFHIASGNNKDTKQLLQAELMPEGEIDWFTETEEVMNTQFEIPKPIVKDSSKQEIKSNYTLNKQSSGNYSLSINLNPEQLNQASFPLVVDPELLDTLAQGDRPIIMRDGWGNLIVISDSATGGYVFYKNYDAESWQYPDVKINNTIAATQTLAGDLDSTGSGHFIWINNSTADVEYAPLKIIRNGNNEITGFGTQAAFALDTSDKTRRVSLVIANKGGGAGVEKIAVLYAMNTTTGGTRRGEERFMQCDVADPCNVAANWKNASEEINGSGACSDVVTSGAAGLPNATTCKGAADQLFIYSSAHTTHHGILMQMPAVPKRTPSSVQKDINGSFTVLSSANDNNPGTSENVNSLTTTDFIYVGDDKPFSKATFDIANTNSNAQLFTTLQYWNGASWSSLSNTLDNTATATVAFSEDGSLLFDEPGNWATTTVNGVSGKYWIRIRPAGAFDSTVSINEVYITDRNSRALVAIGGNDGTNNLIASNDPWDEVNNDRWENDPRNAGSPWQSGIIDSSGVAWTVFTNFPLSAAADYKNNKIFVAYMSGIAVGSSNLNVVSAPENKDLTVSGTWINTSLPATTEASDITFSLTSDGADIYLFYNLDVGIDSFNFRRCSPAGGGSGNTCDNSSDWGSEKTLDNDVGVTLPQVIATKVTGDTVAIDAAYNVIPASDLYYERHFVDLADNTITVAASGDDANSNDCDGGAVFDDQVINSTTMNFGRGQGTGGCGQMQLNPGFHFSNITIGQGTKISSAYIDFRVSSVTNESGPIEFTVYGEDVDNPNGFTAYTDACPGAGNDKCIHDRTRTTRSSSYSINFSTNTYRIDVTDLVQEIVCRGASSSQPCVGDFNGSGSWSSGNSINIFLISTESTDNNNIQILSQDDTGTTMLDPTLQINVAPSGTTDKSYSMGSATKLATGSASFADLDHPFSNSEFSAVSANDTDYASVSASTNFASQSAQSAFMFKVNNTNNNNNYKIDASAVIKSSAPTSTKPVYLQIYRGGSTDDWVTVAANNNTAADTEFTLTSQTISANTSDYYFNETPGIGTQYSECSDGTKNCWVYFRVYQDEPTTNNDEVLSVDYFNTSFTQGNIPPTKIGFSNSTRSLSPGVCNGSAKVFTMELQDDTNTPQNPTSSTVVRVASNSDNYTIYSDSSCSIPVTNGDFTYSTSENSKSVYIIDSSLTTGTKTLSGTRQSGDTLTTGSQNYLLGEIPVRLKGVNRLRGGVRLR